MRPRPDQIKGFQLRGARGLLNMSIARLAREAGVSENAVKKAESSYGQIDLPDEAINALMNALERYRIRWIADLSAFGVAVDLRDRS